MFVIDMTNVFYEVGNQFYIINLLEPELLFLILAHPVYKMWIIQEPNSYNYETNCILKRKKRRVYTPCLKYSVPIFVE